MDINAATPLLLLQEKTYSDAVLNGIAYRPDEDTFYLTGECIYMMCVV